MFKWLLKLYYKISCLTGQHDQYSYAEDSNFKFEDLKIEGKVDYEIIQIFNEQTKLRCRRCKWTYPK